MYPKAAYGKYDLLFFEIMLILKVYFICIKNYLHIYLLQYFKYIKHH